MRRVLLTIVWVIMSMGLRAQCPIPFALDFTATDCHGDDISLFDILDGGQYVLIDFFFVNCGTCNTTVPMMAQSYHTFGCNQHDVYYMEISDRDSDAACQNWCQNYGVAYPTIGKAGGGQSICNTYQIHSFPTVILIAPDRQIVIRDLWPINSEQDIIDQLETQGIEQHSCTTSIMENDNHSLSLFPNPANGQATLRGENLGTVKIYNALGQKIDEFHAESSELTFPTARYNNGVYLVITAEKTQRLVITH